MVKDILTLKQIKEENKKLFQVKIRKELRDFRKLSWENKKKYGEKKIELYKWQIAACREQISVLKGHLKELLKQEKEIENCVKNEYWVLFEKKIFG